MTPVNCCVLGGRPGSYGFGKSIVAAACTLCISVSLSFVHLGVLDLNKSLLFAVAKIYL